MVELKTLKDIVKEQGLHMGDLDKKLRKEAIKWAKLSLVDPQRALIEFHIEIFKFPIEFNEIFGTNPATACQIIREFVKWFFNISEEELSK